MENQRSPLASTLLFCLLLLFGASLLLVGNTIPSIHRNRALRREYRGLLAERNELRQKLIKIRVHHEALLTDPVALQREALLQRGYTPHHRDVIVR